MWLTAVDMSSVTYARRATSANTAAAAAERHLPYAAAVAESVVGNSPEQYKHRPFERSASVTGSRTADVVQTNSAAAETSHLSRHSQTAPREAFCHPAESVNGQLQSNQSIRSVEIKAHVQRRCDALR